MVGTSQHVDKHIVKLHINGYGVRNEWRNYIKC
jgi:hypothetical protein